MFAHSAASNLFRIDNKLFYQKKKKRKKKNVVDKMNLSLLCLVAFMTIVIAQQQLHGIAQRGLLGKRKLRVQTALHLSSAESRHCKQKKTKKKNQKKKKKKEKREEEKRPVISFVSMSKKKRQKHINVRIRKALLVHCFKKEEVVSRRIDSLTTWTLKRKEKSEVQIHLGRRH